MARHQHDQSPMSEYTPPPRWKGKEPTPEGAPLLAIIVHVCPGMPRPKRRQAKPREGEPSEE